MMKVLLLNDMLGRGGKERRVVELIRYCKEHYDVVFEVVIIHDHVKYTEIYDTGYKVHVMDWPAHSTINNFKRLLKITRDFKPDIIHSWSSMTDIMAVILKLYTGKKFISSMIARVTPTRSLKDKDYRRSLIAFPFTDVITANTKAGIESYHAPKSKSICIYNGFDFNRINNLNRAEELRKKHNLEGKFVVGMVAAFEMRKDQETFINAAISLIKKYPGKFVFILIGYGTFEEERKKQAGEYLGKDIIFTGICSIVEQYINIFDVGVLCTNAEKHGEGISNAIMEYMAIGKPVIATEGGGTSEIVTDNETGFLIKAKQPALVEEKILYVMNNPDKAREAALKGQKNVQKNFTIQAMCTAFWDVYKKLAPNSVTTASKKSQAVAEI